MPDSAKEILAGRFASGEISKQEYLDTLETLEPKKHKPNQVNSSIGFTKSIFGKYEDINPTSTKPYKVTKDTYLYDTYLTHKGCEISYDLIEGLHYDGDTVAINGIASHTSASLKIMIKGQSSIYLSGSSAVFKGYKIKAIGNAYKFLIPKSFKSRWNKYIDEMKSRGYILMGGVKIYPNGDVVKKEKKINLKESHESGNLAIGTSFMIGSQGSGAPDEVVVGNGGTSVISERITFNITKDKDVVKQLLHRIATS